MRSVSLLHSSLQRNVFFCCFSVIRSTADDHNHADRYLIAVINRCFITALLMGEGTYVWLITGRSVGECGTIREPA